jgi:FkbM family methyltransferase
VKLRDVPRALGIGSAPREYPSTVATFTLPIDGEVRFAQWQHPNETLKVISQDEVIALREFLRPGDVAIDIGAHTGDSTLPIALALGASGTVFALEPNPYVFKVLAANAELNRTKTNIVPLMFAAMPEDGDFTFLYSDDGYCNGGFHNSVSRWVHGHFVSLRVAGRNLLAYLREHAPEALGRLRYVKIDTEGFDRTVAQSLGELLRIARPYVKSEIYRHMPDEERAGYSDDLRALGYRIFKCDHHVARGQELARGDMARWQHFDILAVPDELA